MPDFGSFRGFGEKLTQGQTPTQLGKIGSEAFGFTGLLDTYPNSAAAYSVRQLRTAYTGSAIRVRRSSDNAEQDIGFLNNELDTVSLTSFCGAGNGFVTTWYDQSGNSINATQTTAANQPQIVSSGSVLLQNGKPCINFDGNDWMANSTNGILRLDLKSHFYVARELTSTNFAGIISFSPLTGNDYDNVNAGNVHTSNGTSVGNTALNTATNTPFISGTKPMPYRLISHYSDSTTAYIQANNGSYQSNTHGYGSNQFQTGKIHIGIRFFGSPDSSFALKGIIQEIVMYNGNSQNSNMSAINTNINSYYAIY